MSTPRSRLPLRWPQEQLIGALVPDFAERPAEPVHLPHLPVPRPVEPTGADFVVGMARIDRTGRVRERSVFDALDWRPGQPLRLDILGGVIVLVAEPAGHHRIDKRGAITLPAAARQMCGIECGPALVLTGIPRKQTLVVHAATILSQLCQCLVPGVR